MNVNIDGISITNPDTAFFVSLLIIVQIALILASTVFIISCISPKRKDERPNRYFLAFIGLFVAYLIGANTFSTSSDLYKAETVKVDTVVVKDDVASFKYKDGDKNSVLEIKLGANYSAKIDGTEMPYKYNLRLDDEDLPSALKNVKDGKITPELKLYKTKKRDVEFKIGLANIAFSDAKVLDESKEYKVKDFDLFLEKDNKGVPAFSKSFD